MTPAAIACAKGSGCMPSFTPDMSIACVDGREVGWGCGCAVTPSDHRQAEAILFFNSATDTSSKVASVGAPSKPNTRKNSFPLSGSDLMNATPLGEKLGFPWSMKSIEHQKACLRPVGKSLDACPGRLKTRKCSRTLLFSFPHNVNQATQIHLLMREPLRFEANHLAAICSPLSTSPQRPVHQHRLGFRYPLVL